MRFPIPLSLPLSLLPLLRSLMSFISVLRNPHSI